MPARSLFCFYCDTKYGNIKIVVKPVTIINPIKLTNNFISLNEQHDLPLS